MSDFVLSCCTAMDTGADWAAERKMLWLPFHVKIGTEDYADDFWTKMKPEQMYERMAQGEESHTSQISVGDYTEHFQKILDRGKDILHVTLSSGISGTVNSANLAADDLRAKYPDRKLIIIDSLAASSGYGLLMQKLYEQKEAGKTIDEVAEYARTHRLNVVHWFFSTDLTYYIRGGRVTKTAGFIGTLLNICPLLNVDYMGHLIPREKIRSKRKVIERIVEKMKELAENGTEYSDHCYISHSACLEDAKAVRDLIEQEFPHMKGNVDIFPIGPTIGCHTGPGTVALFFMGKERID
ncbi:MAG: DegV family protein [Lachnospiraceae bacterium]|nr:DegV family protein [Lachnospiraceae bacterium]MBR0092675.1 DegV family protein [Lachnospiraceae bacterium]